MTFMRNTLATAALLGALAAVPYAHAAEPCKLEISGNDLMQYDKPELSAPATCKEITVTLHHSGKLPKEAMGHNWVLAHTKTIGGGESTSVTFPTSILKKGGAYQYLCTFPGHNALMHGSFKFG